MIKIYRESTSFSKTFLICITHLSELCADAKGKVERFFSFSSLKDLALLGTSDGGMSFSLLLLYSKNFHSSFEIEDCLEKNGLHLTSYHTLTQYNICTVSWLSVLDFEMAS